MQFFFLYATDNPRGVLPEMSSGNTLIFTMAAVVSGAEDIVLTLSDGESYALENAITVP